MKIAVIGAGPAGMTAALEAARSGGKVALFDKNRVSGRKLRVTGGGRGNLTNLKVSFERYSCGHCGSLQVLEEDFQAKKIMDYLESLGIHLYHTEDGWVYPLSNSAANAADLLEARANESGVEFRFNTMLDGIKQQENGFRLHFTDGAVEMADRVVIASGGMASPNLGASGEMYGAFEKLGHKIVQVHPALAPLLLDMKTTHSLQGVRLDAGIKLLKGKEKIAETVGNIIFTNWGVNGPGVMDISHWINRYPPKSLKLEINFIPYQEERAGYLLQKELGSQVPLHTLIGAFLPPKAVRFFIRQSGLAAEARMNELDGSTIRLLIAKMQRMRVDVLGVKGFEHCQASTGGIALEEVDLLTLQSRLCKGLFFAGEILDVVGPCGGYNLHWAFSSGMRSGRSCMRG